MVEDGHISSGMVNSKMIASTEAIMRQALTHLDTHHGGIHAYAQVGPPPLLPPALHRFTVTTAATHASSTPIGCPRFATMRSLNVRGTTLFLFLLSLREVESIERLRLRFRPGACRRSGSASRKFKTSGGAYCERKSFRTTPPVPDDSRQSSNGVC